jgi:hypothetical protein
MNHIRICGCCDDSLDKLVKALRSLTKEQIVHSVVSKMKKSSPKASNATIQGMIDIIVNPPDKLGKSGENLIKECINFLLVKQMDDNKLWYPKKNQSDFHKEKYITIWSFIYDFLKITKDSGFDYFLMAYLDTHDYLEHGSGIRCGWLSSNINLEYSIPSINRPDDRFVQYIHKVMAQAQAKDQHSDVMTDFENFKLRLDEWAFSCPDDV